MNRHMLVTSNCVAQFPEVEETSSSEFVLFIAGLVTAIAILLLIAILVDLPKGDIGTIEALHGFWEWIAERASLGVN